MASFRVSNLKMFPVLLIVFCASTAIAQTSAQTPKKVVRVFIDVRESNFDKPSSVALNTLSERLTTAGFRVTTNKREAAIVVDGTIASRSTPVTDEVKKQGGINAEASASVRLLVGSEVIATSVERSGPGDWGVQQERVGEDRLVEVAGLVADDLFSPDLMHEVTGAVHDTGASTTTRKSPAKSVASAKKKPRKGVGFLEVVALVQNSAPEDRIVAALKKYGIKFKPRDAALNELRTAGASETVITAVKNSAVLV